MLARSDQIQADVQRWGAVCQPAYREEIDTCFGDGWGALEINAPRRLEDGPAVCDSNRLSELVEAHIVEKDDFYAHVERLSQLI